MRSTPLLILLFLALAAHGQPQERVAILNTVDDRDSIGFSDLSYLTTRFREIAVNTLPKPRYAVMSIQSIIDFLGSEEQAIKVCKEMSCLAELGRKVSADYVAQARIGRFEKNLTIGVELYSSKHGTMVGSFTGDSKSLRGLRDVIDKQAPLLFKKMPGVSDEPKPTPPPPTVTTTPTPPPPPPTPPIPKDVPPVESEKKSYNDQLDYEYEKYKRNLYEEDRKRDAFGWALLNVLPGFGLGSYLQEDEKTARWLFIADLSGWSLYLLGLGAGHEYYNIMHIGVILWSGVRVAGFIFPFYHQYSYNKELKERLKLTYSIDPLIIPKDGAPAVGLALNLRY